MLLKAGQPDLPPGCGYAFPQFLQTSDFDGSLGFRLLKNDFRLTRLTDSSDVVCVSLGLPSMAFDCRSDTSIERPRSIMACSVIAASISARRRSLDDLHVLNAI